MKLMPTVTIARHLTLARQFREKAAEAETGSTAESRALASAERHEEEAAECFARGLRRYAALSQDRNAKDQRLWYRRRMAERPPGDDTPPGDRYRRRPRSTYAGYAGVKPAKVRPVKKPK